MGGDLGSCCGRTKNLRCCVEPNSLTLIWGDPKVIHVPDGGAILIPEYGDTTFRLTAYPKRDKGGAGRPANVPVVEMHAGQLHLPCGGDWSIKAETLLAFADTHLTVTVFHACDPGAAMLLRRRAPMFSFDGTVVVGAADTAVRPLNRRREYVYLQNMSDKKIWVRFYQAAAPDAGILLTPCGGAWDADSERGEHVPRGKIQAIGAIGGQNLSVIEAE